MVCDIRRRWKLHKAHALHMPLKLTFRFALLWSSIMCTQYTCRAVLSEVLSANVMAHDRHDFLKIYARNVNNSMLADMLCHKLGTVGSAFSIPCDFILENNIVSLLILLDYAFLFGFFKLLAASL